MEQNFLVVSPISEPLRLAMREVGGCLLWCSQCDDPGRPGRTKIWGRYQFRGGEPRDFDASLGPPITPWSQRSLDAYAAHFAKQVAGQEPAIRRARGEASSDG
jgi:hypothetical protein